MNNRSVNLIPFGELLRSNGESNISEIILNVVIFIPLGIYTGVLFKKWSLKIKFIFFFLLSFMFEALQFTLRIGAFDSTDLITNTSGGILGLLVFEAIDKSFDRSDKTQKFINIIAGMATLVMISLLLLLKLSMLPVKYQ